MDFDCAVIGAGPSGLHCGTYLGRFLRNTIIFDGGRPRASWIPITRNFPCFPAGVTGSALLKCLREQAAMYGSDIHAERVHAVAGADGRFEVQTDSGTFAARKVILATGVFDIPPEIPNADRYKGLTIRHCPVCDAYEARDRKLVTFGHGDHGAQATLWLAHYTRDITLLLCGRRRDEISGAVLAQLDEAGIPVLERRVERIEEKGDELGTVRLDDGTAIENVFRGYSVMGLRPNSDLAAAMGADLDDEGYITVDGDQQTSVKGVYAVGDVAGNDVAQVVVGMGHAAIATTHIHNALRGHGGP